MPNNQAPDPIVEQAKQLVHDALRAETDGNADLRVADLKQALTLAPDLPEAHWQLGEVRRGTHWLSTADAEKEITATGKMADYRKLRDQADATLEDQLKIARWCDKNGLDDEEKAHSRVALQLDSNQPEAMRRLGLISFRGQLISKSQLDQAKAEFHQTVLDSKEWRDRLFKLRWQYERDADSRNETLSQICSIRDVKAIPAMESVFGDADPEPMIAAIEALSAMKDLKATQSLVRFAVLAEPTTARYAAAQALKSRDPYAYIPMLLAGLQEPIVGEYLAAVDRTNHGGPADDRISYFQEQSDRYNLDVTFAHVRRVFAIWPIALRTPQPEDRFKLNLNAVNEANLQRNKQISIILADVTDQKLGDDPKAWWNWWYAQNEFYQPPEKPIETQYAETSVMRV
ncbi:MAG TPA: HEAT repeat domain-containing protein, partial [Pirellulales bacterium]